MNLSVVEDNFAVVTKNVGVAVYDFDFELHFNCSHPYIVSTPYPTFFRIGAIEKYEEMYAETTNLGLLPVNTPAEHSRASELTEWYPLISKTTPRSIWFESPPDVSEVEANFDWPVFIKGSRQTAKHNPSLSIARDANEYGEICEKYKRNTILHWQAFVVREFVPLMKLSGRVPEKIQPSVEFRTFWLNGACVGVGNYWYQLPEYGVVDLDAGIELARDVAKKLAVPFLVVDIAKTMEEHWIVVECNDGQESGYARISPNLLWSKVLEQRYT